MGSEEESAGSRELWPAGPGAPGMALGFRRCWGGGRPLGELEGGGGNHDCVSD